MTEEETEEENELDERAEKEKEETESLNGEAEKTIEESKKDVEKVKGLFL